jgi:hypothetical protein
LGGRIDSSLKIYVIQIAPAGHSYHERKRNGEWKNESAAEYSLI